MREGNVKDDNEVSITVNKGARVSIANTGGNSHRWRDVQISDEVDLVSTTGAVFLCQLHVRNCFAVAF